MRLSYYPATEVYPVAGGTVEFDEIGETFSDAAEALSLKGVEGQGWAWTVGATALVAWRYPDGHTALARLSCWDGWCGWGPDLQEDEYELGFRTVLAGALARLPQAASGPARSGSLPAGPGSASPSASSSASP